MSNDIRLIKMSFFSMIRYNIRYKKTDDCLVS